MAWHIGYSVAEHESHKQSSNPFYLVLIVYSGPCECNEISLLRYSWITTTAVSSLDIIEAIVFSSKGR